MNENNVITDTLLSREVIVNRAREKWDSKSRAKKIRSSHKYKHIFNKLGLPLANWDDAFSNLSKNQTNILVKGELIRTYDSMTNKEKTKLKNKFGLSSFSSKWFRLSPSDKKILLNSIIK